MSFHFGWRKKYNIKFDILNYKFLLYSKMNALHDKHLEQYLKKTINKIKVGYTIIEIIADGADSYGMKYWAICKNGIEVRSWEVNTLKNNDINGLFSNIVNNGYVKDGTTYYYDKYSLDKLKYNLLLKYN